MSASKEEMEAIVAEWKTAKEANGHDSPQANAVRLKLTELIKEAAQEPARKLQ